MTNIKSDFILVRRRGNRGQRARRRAFSVEDLNCRRLDEQRLECIDPEFGIFEII